MHKDYEKYYITIIKEKESTILAFEGARKETEEEKATREAMETLKRKKIEEAELKEYLRLHKKYGKKE
jgi:hypothetical protein